MPRTPALLLLLPAALLALSAALAAQPATAHAQDSMAFDAEDTQPRAFVYVRAESGVSKKDRAAILKRVETFVAQDGTFATLSERDAKSAAGKKGWTAFTRCKDIACHLEQARNMGVDRLILLDLAKEDGATTVDIELNDTFTERLINYTAAVTDTPADLAFLDKPLDELLHGQNDVGAPTLPEADNSLDFSVAEPVKEAPPEEPFLLTPTWAYLTWAGAGALALTGGVFGVLASGAQEDLQKNPKPRAEVEQLILEGQSNQSTANLLFISAAGLAAVGGLLFWLADDVPEEDNRRRPRLPSASLDLLLSPSAVGLQLRY